MDEKIAKMIEEEKKAEQEALKQETVAPPLREEKVEPQKSEIVSSDLAETARQNAISQIQQGKKFGEVADDLFDAKLTSDILQDEDKLSNLRDLKEKELQAKREAKIKQEEAEREKAVAEKIKQEAERTRQENEKIKEQGNQEKQNQDNIYQKYEWCLKKVGIRGNVPKYQAYLAMAFFTFLAFVYWLSIGAVIGILMLALDQIGQLALTIGEFLEKSAKAQRGLVKFIISFILLLLTVAIVAGIVFLVFYIKGKYFA